MQHKFEESVIEDIKNMDQRLTELEEKIDSINTKLTQVVAAIMGNPLTKQGGFISDMEMMEKKIEKLEKKVESHEEFKKKVYWGIAIIGFLLVAGEYILKVYTSVK